MVWKFMSAHWCTCSWLKKKYVSYTSVCTTTSIYQILMHHSLIFLVSRGYNINPSTRLCFYLAVFLSEHIVTLVHRWWRPAVLFHVDGDKVQCPIISQVSWKFLQQIYTAGRQAGPISHLCGFSYGVLHPIAKVTKVRYEELLEFEVWFTVFPGQYHCIFRNVIPYIGSCQSKTQLYLEPKVNKDLLFRHKYSY